MQKSNLFVPFMSCEENKVLWKWPLASLINILYSTEKTLRNQTLQLILLCHQWHGKFFRTLLPPLQIQYNVGVSSLLELGAQGQFYSLLCLWLTNVRSKLKFLFLVSLSSLI